MTNRHWIVWALLAGLAVAAPAGAGIHTWDVSEVFSNADGSVQFIELEETAGGAGETGVGNGSISSNSESHSWSNGAVAAPTSDRFYLIATAAFAALPGAPTPDVILPAGVVPFFSAAGDTVAFGGFDSCAVPAIPTDGTTAYDCLAAGTALNSPTNYAGDVGSVDAGAPPAPTAIPAAPAGALVAIAGGLLVAGALLASGVRRR